MLGFLSTVCHCFQFLGDMRIEENKQKTSSAGRVRSCRLTAEAPVGPWPKDVSGWTQVSGDFCIPHEVPSSVPRC